MSEPDDETPAVLDSTQPITALIVDDDPDVHGAFRRVLTSAGIGVTCVESGAAALASLESATFDVVVSDVMMPGMTGTELLRAIRERDLEMPVILLSGVPSVQTAMEAVELGAYRYLAKPIPAKALTDHVVRAAHLGRLSIIKRKSMEALGSALPHAGDRIGLALTFDRAMASLRMAYQPIVRAADRSLFGYEALMRSGEPALPHPGAILDAAQRLDAIRTVGRRVRRLAPKPFEDAPGDAALFINLHASDLVDPELLDRAAPLAGIASRVVLEITERASLDGIPNVRETLATLREIGFRMAIDDLGAGYAGLTAFASVEPEIVKLDMSLIRDIDTLATKQKLVRSMTSLCHDLGMLVVAEGIETADERDCVVELGCDLLQGYLLARPGPAFPSFVWP